MKTSLICLLLLAAVACASPQAGEVEGEVPEELVGEAIEAVEEAAGEDTALAASAGGTREERFGFGYSPCYGPCGGAYGGGYPYGGIGGAYGGAYGGAFGGAYGGFGCWFDGCYSPYDFLYSNGYCACCRVRSSIQCYY